MIPIKCLKKVGQKSNHVISGQRHEFSGGEHRTVSCDIAEVLLAKRDNLGNPIFERVEIDTKEIQEALGLQLEWNSWPL